MIKRHIKNPIITRSDIPDIYPDLVDVSSVFNPGAIKFNNRYILLLRVQNRGRETFIVKAESSDGIDFRVDNKIVDFKGIEKVNKKIYHIYDARITCLVSRQAKIKNDVLYNFCNGYGCRAAALD